MYGYIYVTTNLVTGMKYIGKHKATSFEFDKYQGSGVYFSDAYKKYGKDKFETKLLESINGVPTVCETAEELNASECYYVEFYDCVKSVEYYNIAPGGQGGDCYTALPEEKKNARDSIIAAKSANWWATADEETLRIRYEKWVETYHNHTEEELATRAENNSLAQKRYNASLTLEECEERRAKLKIVQQKRVNNPEVEALRKQREKETKSKHTSKQRAAYKEKQQQAQIGRKYFTNGVDVVKCFPEDAPEGWYEGGAHHNNFRYFCYYNDEVFEGRGVLCEYLKQLGYTTINPDKLTAIARGTYKRLRGNLRELEGKIRIVERNNA